jgi:bifunctional DNA primase/polymerase-like protein/primase-like protein
MRAAAVGTRAARLTQRAYATRSRLLKAALGFAAQGWAVFPCRPGGKTPLVDDWPRRATTDPRRITAWLHRWPNANIAIVTGLRSGILALDVDYAPALEGLEARHGKLPATRRHSTGSGGLHYIYRYPTGANVRNSAGRLGKGLDVRGEGGYIIAPPSCTTGPYEVRNDLPLADPPEWFLEALREPQSDRRGKPGEVRGGAITALDGPPIPEGQRNETLTRIGGRLHDGSRTLEALTADLVDISNTRCELPLPNAELRRIALSIYQRPPCKPSGPKPSPEALEALDAVGADILHREWPGMGGKSERDVYIALQVEGRKHSKLIPAGVRVAISYGELAVRAGVSKRALLDYRKNGKARPGIISRLKRRGLLRADNAERGAAEAGAFVLVIPQSHKFHHSTSRGGGIRDAENACGETFATEPRLRWSAPEIRRLGKTRGAVVDILRVAGREISEVELCEALYPGKPADKHRLYYLRHTILPPLVEASVVECLGRTVALTTGYREALERVRLRGGELAAETRDRERHKRQSEEHRLKLAAPESEREKIRIPPTPEEKAACQELEEIRRSNRERRRAGVERRKLRDLKGLERVGEPEASPALVEAVVEGLEKNRSLYKESLCYRVSWLANWAWSEDKVACKPPLADVEAVLLGLGGERVAV